MAYGQSDPTTYRQWEMPQEALEAAPINFGAMDMVSLANILNAQTIVNLSEADAQALARLMAKDTEATEILKERGVHKPLTYMGSGMRTLVERTKRKHGALARPISGEVALSLSNPIMDVLMDLEMVKKGIENRDPLMTAMGATFIAVPITARPIYDAIAKSMVRDVIAAGAQVTQKQLSDMGQRAWQETLSALPPDQALKAASERAQSLENGFAELAGTADQEAKDILQNEAMHNRFVIESRAKNEGFEIPSKLKAQLEEGPGAQAVGKELDRGGVTTVTEGQAALFPEEIVPPAPERVASDVVTAEGREGVAALQLAREEAELAAKARGEDIMEDVRARGIADAAADKAAREEAAARGEDIMEDVRASGIADAAAEREAKERAAAEMADRHSKQRARNIREEALKKQAEQEAQAKGAGALERFQSQQRAAGVRDDAAAASRASDTETISQMGDEAAALGEAQGIWSRKSRPAENATKEELEGWRWRESQRPPGARDVEGMEMARLRLQGIEDEGRILSPERHSPEYLKPTTGAKPAARATHVDAGGTPEALAFGEALDAFRAAKKAEEELQQQVPANLHGGVGNLYGGPLGQEDGPSVWVQYNWGHETHGLKKGDPRIGRPVSLDPADDTFAPIRELRAATKERRDTLEAMSEAHQALPAALRDQTEAQVVEDQLSSVLEDQRAYGMSMNTIQSIDHFLGADIEKFADRLEVLKAQAKAPKPSEPGVQPGGRIKAPGWVHDSGEAAASTESFRRMAEEFDKSGGMGAMASADEAVEVSSTPLVSLGQGRGDAHYKPKPKAKEPTQAETAMMRGEWKPKGKPAGEEPKPKAEPKEKKGWFFKRKKKAGKGAILDELKPKGLAADLDFERAQLEAYDKADAAAKEEAKKAPPKKKSKDDDDIPF